MNVTSWCCTFWNISGGSDNVSSTLRLRIIQHENQPLQLDYSFANPTASYQLATLQKGRVGDTGLTIPTSKVPQVQLDYVRKEREVKYHEALFEMLSRQYEAARLDEARDAPLVQVLDPPSWPDTKSSPRRMLIALAGLLTGLLLGSIWALIRGSRFVSPDRAISSIGT